MKKPLIAVAILLGLAAVAMPLANADELGGYGPPEISRRGLPEGVPNIFDPEVRNKFQPVGVSKMGGNPDFPVLLVVNTTGEQPQAMLLALDARNGKNSWALGSDPLVMIVLFSDEQTVSATYFDLGFATEGKPSGIYASVEPGLDQLVPGPMRPDGAPATKATPMVLI